MPMICYTSANFTASTKRIIGQANKIIVEYAALGYDLTLRQLYYQFVARGLIRNKQSEYKRLGDIVNNARLAGLIDWDRITDRTRNLRVQSHWDSPADIIVACEQSFRLDKWERQPYRPEVWIEKDALIGVLDQCCPALDVPYFSCRGYVSQSEMWSAAMRLKQWERAGQKTVIFHLGDHDPSGVDMSRDIQDRLRLFGSIADVERLALTMEQVEEHNPPPNPAKMTDARASGYVDLYGDESWELDALDPATITSLINEAVAAIRDEEKWQDSLAEENEHRRLLGVVAHKWHILTGNL